MTLPSHLPSTCTKQTTYSLFLTNSNNMLYYRRLIRALGLSVPASLMRPRRAVLQTPPKSSVLLRLPFYKSCPPLTHAQSTLLQLLIPFHFNSPRISAYKKLGRGSLLPAPKICNSLLLPYFSFQAKRAICFFSLPPLPSYLIASLHRYFSSLWACIRTGTPVTSFLLNSSLATVPVTPFSAALSGHSQLTENPSTLTSAFVTLARRVKHKSFVWHSYKKHPGWGYSTLSSRGVSR